MSFLAIIPIWLGCLACYLGSEKQQILTKPLTKWLAYSLLLIGYLSGCALFSTVFAIPSSFLAALVALMLALIAHTILNAYINRIFLFNGLTVTVLIMFAGVSYVA